MKKAEAMTLLEEHANERGIAHWKKLGPEGMKSFGIGLTQLRKLAKKIGRDHSLAKKLWASNVYDAKIVSLLIDEPAKMTREQAEDQVERLEAGMLAHVYCSCDATLPKTAFAVELARDWASSEDDTRRRCGYLLLYELSKDKKNPELDDEFFLSYLSRIEKRLQKEENFVKDAMNTALLGIGKRNARLHKAALKVARAVGKVEVDYGDNSCEAMDVVKHLTSDYLKKKFAK